MHERQPMVVPSPRIVNGNRGPVSRPDDADAGLARDGSPIHADNNTLTEVETIIADASRQPLNDAAYMLWREQSRLDRLECTMTLGERENAQAAPIEESATGITNDHDHPEHGTTFSRLKRAHPKASDAKLKQAIIAAVKFNDDCFKHFSSEASDFSRSADHAVAMAAEANPGYLEGTYKFARYWVMYCMK